MEFSDYGFIGIKFDSLWSKVKINSKYIQDWSYKCLYGDTLRVFVSYPSLKNKVGVKNLVKDFKSEKLKHKLNFTYENSRGIIQKMRG